jgi:TonB-linked SusC/RagA family outer membrane protein
VAKVVIFFVSIYFLPVFLFAQENDVKITGKVLDEKTQELLIGATVSVKGTTTAAITDINGRYTISAPQHATLVFHYIGFETLEIAVDSRTTINVALAPEFTQLDEVVVVAYGTTTKERFTGSVAVVKGEKLTKGETSNVTKALEGSVAGVQISSATGQPGAGANIRVRGLGSISAGSSPLIVVDGVPYEGELSSISPRDIETLSVLKDAAATSMYGARGSNGVLLITTKKGNTGKVKINFEARVSINSRGVSAYDVLTNPSDYYELTWEAQRNGLVESGTDAAIAGQTINNTLISSILGYNIYKGVADDALIDPVTGKINPAATQKKWNELWATDPFKNNTRQEYNFNASGGTENTNAFFSLGYIDDGGIVDKSDFSRVTVRGKVDHKYKDFFKAGVNLAYAQTKSNVPVGSTGGNNFSNIFMFSQYVAPIYPIYKYDLGSGAPIYNADGSHAFDFGSENLENGVASRKTRAYAEEQNPLFVLQSNENLYVRDNLSSRAYVEAKFLKDFTFTANIAYDIFHTAYTYFINPIIGDGRTYGGIGEKENVRYAALNANQLLNYSKKIDKHKIDVLLGHEIKSDERTYLFGEKMQYYDPYNPELANAGSVSSLTSYGGKYRLEGYLSRAEYIYDNRYSLSGSFRRDASSRFHPDVRWGNFWSTGVAWRAKAESFLSDIEQINNLRLRASYGTQGNDAIYLDDIPLYNVYSDQYEITSDGQHPSPLLVYRGAPDLTWEKSTNLTLGLESEFFDRLVLNVDYFIKNTNDMIYRKPLPASLGTPTWVWDNQIDMRNSGWEIDLTVDILKSNDITWSVGANATLLNNELTRLPADKTDPKGYQDGRYWRKKGGSLYDFYLKQYAGVDQTTGKALWYKDETDATGVVTGKTTTNVYSDATYYETGKSAIPDVYGGFSTDVKAYGFDLSIQTAFQTGGYAYDGVYATLMNGGTSRGQNLHKDILDRWTSTNTDTNVPRLSAGDAYVVSESDRYLTSSSYFSLKNITLGYSLPRRLVDKIGIQTLRVYVSGENLWLKSARQGFDPRQSFSGATYTGTYSALRTLSLGLSISL